MNTTTRSSTLQQALKEMTAERDALQRSGMLMQEFTGKECAYVEEERDEAREEVRALTCQYSFLEDKYDELERQLAATKPTPPPVAPRKKATPSLTIEERLAALETENDRLRTGMHNFNVDRNEAWAALEERESLRDDDLFRLNEKVFG